MSKNRLDQISSKKEARAEEKARAEAEAELQGKAPWEDEGKEGRISMRIEKSLKAAYKEKLPRFASVSDALREHMIQVAKGDVKP